MSKKPPEGFNAHPDNTQHFDLRVDLANGIRLGPGKMALLALIGEKGSISAAGQAMGMSYRRAWLLVEEINTMFQQPAILTRHGGKAGGGAYLSDFGQELLALCQRMQAKTAAAIEAELAWLAAQTAQKP